MSMGLAQLSDPHVRVGPRDRDAARGLMDAVSAVAALDPRPDAVIVTGDLADTAAAREYERVRELLAPLPMPVYVLAGNHDDPDALRELFGPLLPGTPAGAPFQYAAVCGPLRLLACDTTVRGEDAGRLGPERLAWLDQELAADPLTPAVIAMHHPPVITGVRAIDEVALAAEDQAALGRLVARHPQVRLIAGGHVHRAVFSRLGGSGVFACPSTDVQLALDLTGNDSFALVREPPGFGLHLLLGAELTSHLQPIGDYPAAPLTY